MNTPLPPVQMLWIGGPLSTLERLSLNSFVRNGHEVHLYTYGRPANTPKGLVIKDAGEILPAPAGDVGPAALISFSERFRIKLLHERGGIWSNIDVVCVKPLEFAAGMDSFFASEMMPAQAGDEGRIRVRASNCVFKAPAGSPILQECLPEAVEGVTGAMRLHTALEKFNMLGALLNPNLFCPIPFWNMPSLLSGLTTLPAETHGVNCFAETWRRSFFDPNASYEPYCLFERLKAHFLGAAVRKDN